MTQTTTTATTSRNFLVAYGGMLIACWLVLQWKCVDKLTPTHDEYWHLPIGLDILETGRFDQDVINPPLVRTYAALPLLASDIDMSKARIKAVPGEEHTYGDRFVAMTYQQDVRKLYGRSRFAIALLTIAGAVALAHLAFEFAGPLAAMLTLPLLLFDPNIFAHSGLVTHDAPTAAIFSVSVWAMWRYVGRASLKNLALCAAVIGIAQVTKFTSLILLPVFAVIVLVSRSSATKPTAVTKLGHLALGFATIGLIVNAAYGFTHSFTPRADVSIESSLFSLAVDAISIPTINRVPLPADYVRGIDTLFVFLEGEHATYLDGTWTPDGFRTYYIMCWAYKAPHILQALAMIGLFVIARETADNARLKWLLVLLVTIASLLLVPASFARNQFGVRYLLPVYPFAIFFAACGVGRLLSRYSTRAQATALIAVTLVAGLSLRHTPNNLAYFNELAGGPTGGRHHLVDSNLDWGQSLHEFNDYLKSQDANLDGFTYFGTYPQVSLGITTPLVPPGSLQTGRFALSVNLVQGRPHAIRRVDGSFLPIAGEAYGQYRFFTPETVIGETIYVYDLSQDDIDGYFKAFDKASDDFPDIFK